MATGSNNTSSGFSPWDPPYVRTTDGHTSTKAAAAATHIKRTERGRSVEAANRENRLSRLQSKSCTGDGNEAFFCFSLRFNGSVIADLFPFNHFSSPLPLEPIPL